MVNDRRVVFSIEDNHSIHRPLWRRAGLDVSIVDYDVTRAVHADKSARSLGCQMSPIIVHRLGPFGKPSDGIASRIYRYRQENNIIARSTQILLCPSHIGRYCQTDIWARGVDKSDNYDLSFELGEGEFLAILIEQSEVWSIRWFSVFYAVVFDFIIDSAHASRKPS